MQLLLRQLDGKTRCFQADPEDRLEDVCLGPQEAHDDVFLTHQQQRLCWKSTVEECKLTPNAVISMHGRLRGGKPVKVDVITSSPSGKDQVTIDIEEAATKSEVKMKLVSVTGIPYEHQKVVLSGIGQLAVADKRSNIGFASCGSTNGIGLAVAGGK